MNIRPGFYASGHTPLTMTLKNNAFPTLAKYILESDGSNFSDFAKRKLNVNCPSDQGVTFKTRGGYAWKHDAVWYAIHYMIKHNDQLVTKMKTNMKKIKNKIKKEPKGKQKGKKSILKF